ncbi:ankyrin repeat domain-containing protein 50-like [Haliotis cracherodii]|uniref:ankyrin repeat domain-containing protein 50-like n=1 Tax=Haliotis cracherodii TaxID=6455 RepID=UPI0039E81B70
MSRCLETRVGKVVCVKRGTQTHRLHKSRERILYDACRQGCLNRIKRILSDGRVDVNNRDAKDGMTPSMLAAFLGYKHVFDLLVSNGGDLSLVDNNGENILQAACHGGSLDIIKYVLPLSIVDINSRDRYGRTPLMMAIFYGHRDVYDLLLSKGANASLFDNYYDKTVHIACITGHVRMMNYVISQNTAAINTRGHYGRTPVMIAAEYGHREAFDLLVSIGADMSLVDNNSDKNLHVACFGGHVEMVEYLLSQNTAAINTRGHFGRTPVMIAAEYGHREAFDLLVRKGADVFLVDDSNDTILHVACFGGHVEMVQYLLSKITVDINCKGNYGRTPVMVAAEKGHRKTFDLLVKQGADVSLVDDNGYNILHLASLAGRVQMVTYLISHEYVDLNGKNKFGYTAAMIAANEKHKAVFDILVSKSNV